MDWWGSWWWLALAVPLFLFGLFCGAWLISDEHDRVELQHAARNLIPAMLLWVGLKLMDAKARQDFSWTIRRRYPLRGIPDMYKPEDHHPWEPRDTKPAAPETDSAGELLKG